MAISLETGGVGLGGSEGGAYAGVELRQYLRISTNIPHFTQFIDSPESVRLITRMHNPDNHYFPLLFRPLVVKINRTYRIDAGAG